MTQLETIRYVFLPIAVVVIHKSRKREGESIQLISKTQLETIRYMFLPMAVVVVH